MDFNLSVQVSTFMSYSMRVQEPVVVQSPTPIAAMPCHMKRMRQAHENPLAAQYQGNNAAVPSIIPISMTSLFRPAPWLSGVFELR